MKNIYTFRPLTAFLSLFCCWSLSIFAQTPTNPAPQALPYTQNFDGLAINPTTYPAGFQGWAAALTVGSTYNVSGAPNSNRTLASGGKANSTAANIYNYDGKIGFQNTGDYDFTIALAINATGQKAVQVQYEAMTIRNPYGTGTNVRINEMVLQYRIGDTDNFTSLFSTAYSNNTVSQATAVTTPQNLQSFKVTLPSVCDNEPVVQVRWISRQVSGSGSRPSFAIDNIDVRSDIMAPVSAIGYPKTDNILSESFDFSDQLDEIGKTYFVLLPGGSATPTAAQVKAGVDASDAAALQFGFLDITNPSQPVVKTFSGLVLGTSYSVFSISEDANGNIQSVVTQKDVTTSNVAIPSLLTTVSALNLGFSEPNYSSEIFSYQIKGANVTAPVTVSSSAANFVVSKDNTNFSSSISFDAADFASNAAVTVYVQFTPTALGESLAQLTHETTGATSKIVSLSGAGINPYVQGFNDVNVLTNSGWTEYSVAGNSNRWISTTTARNVNSGTGAVLMNGYSESGASNDWLISPKLRLDNFTDLALLSFYSRKFYEGTQLKLMVSVNYDGKSSPETATWTALEGNFPVETGTYKLSQNIDLGAYKTNHTYLAWVYETTAGGTNNAAEWSVDDIAITNLTNYLDANPVLSFGDASPNTISATQSFIFKAVGYNDLTLTAPVDYQLSLDGTAFQSNVVVTTADAAAGKTIFVRFTPSVKALEISGKLKVTGTGLDTEIGMFTGSSLPKAETFDVVTYNLEFFGTAVKDASGQEFGPTNNALQIENVAKVMNKLDADVYVVQEVSDDPSIDILIQKINVNGKTFEKSISTSWSYSFNPPQDTFPPQKLVVLYNTQTTTVKKERVMFKKLYDDVRNGTATLPNYPGGNGSSFFSSGRLPYMVKIETNIGGVKKEIDLIDIHARANSGSDISRYNMRKYDAELLRDSLIANYPDSNYIILGDYNDDVKASVIPGNPSSYQTLVEDTANFNALTLDISKAGAFSFLSSGGFLDHIMISNELTDSYIPNSTAVYDPRNDISNYVNTTSDHGPVIARFEFKPALSTIDFGTKTNSFATTYPNPATDVVNVVLKANQNKDLKLRLYDSTGRLIGSPLDIKAGENNNTGVIQISNLASGIYFYTLTENNKVVFRDKIIKK